MARKILSGPVIKILSGPRRLTTTKILRACLTTKFVKLVDCNGLEMTKANVVCLVQDEVVKVSPHARAIRDVEDEELRSFFYGMSPWQVNYLDIPLCTLDKSVKK